MSTATATTDTAYEIVIPATTNNPTGGFTLGDKFRVTEPCDVTGVLFETDAGNPVAAGWKIKLYRESDRVLLATKTVTATPGVNRAAFDTPVAVLPDVLYLACSYNPAGSGFMHSTTYSGPVDNGPIHIYGNAEHGASAGTYTGVDGYPDTDWGATLIGSPTPLVTVHAVTPPTPTLGTSYPRALEVAEALRAAGINATADPRSATPPCVLVGVPDREYSIGGGHYVARWSIYALVPGAGNADAHKAVDALADAVAAELPIERVTFISYPLASETVPAYRLEYEEGI